jgi:hypothetical protein
MAQKVDHRGQGDRAEMTNLLAEGSAERSERMWRWSFWMAILAFEAIGLLLSSGT